MTPPPDFVVPLIINGSPTTTSETFPVTSPTTSKAIWSSSTATISDCNNALSAASKAFKSWRESQLSTRRDLLLKTADEMRAQREEIIEAMMQETAASRDWAEFNLTTGENFLREVAGRVYSLEGWCPESEEPGRFCQVWREPLGVVLAIAPWNAPVILSIRSILYPLAAGNTVLFKSSELSPYTHFLIASLFTRHFPANTVSVISFPRSTAPQITTHLIAHPAVKKVNFTGSTEIGRKVAAACGEHLKPVTLELGGKAPCIVLEDADLQEAARKCAFGAFHHAGQICMSTERIIVVRSVKERFVGLLREEVEKAYGEGQVLVTKDGKEKAGKLVEEARADGAKVLGAAQGKEDGNMARNLIVDGVTKSMRIWREESFGPCVSIIEVDTEDEAVELANDNELGLSSAVWTKDLMRGLRIARRIEAGVCHVNGATVHDEPSMPHGGVKASGFGRFNGNLGLFEFTTTKTVTFRA